MSVGVIGQGFVGGSLTTVFSERGETVYVYDKAGKLAAGGINGFKQSNSDMILCPGSIAEFVQQCEGKSGFSGVFFVCVPTPMYEDGSPDISIVEDVLELICAAKVSFANEVAQICEALDADGLNIDYDKVVEYSKVDRRLGETHWAVPGPVPTHDGRYVRGFGGHCFPKDINGLISVARKYNINPNVMQAAWEKNLEVRGPDDRDWEKQVGRAVSKRKQ
jgi:UDP-glucose 6-dehydrogenase